MMKYRGSQEYDILVCGVVPRWGQQGQTHDFATIKSEKNVNYKYFHSHYFSFAIENAHSIL